jgi:hypothetical protein
LFEVESGLINTTRGDTTNADADLLDAALLMTGGNGSTALAAWDTFEEGADAFAAGATGANN